MIGGLAAAAQARKATNDPERERKHLAQVDQPLIIRSYVVALCALLFVSCGPTVAQSIAVFDFELIDTSLEGAIRGARPDEQERLAHLSDQLRQLLRDSGRFSLVDLGSILARRYHADRTRGAGKQPASLRWLRYALGAASTRNKDRIWKRPITPSPSLRRFAGV